MSHPGIFVIAGPNGSGKSTAAAAVLPKRFPTDKFLNADNIAKALATDSPFEAGRGSEPPIVHDQTRFGRIRNATES